MTNRKLAFMIAASEGFVGGYLYGGTTAALTYKGERLWRLDHKVHSVKKYDQRPLLPMVAWNKRLLATAPIGAIVDISTRLQGYNAWETWEKVGPCKWALISSDEELFDE